VDLTIARRKMIDSQIRPDDVTDERVIAAFETIPREVFLPKAMSAVAYSEVELETVTGNKLWLARDLSKMLQALEVKSSDLALVIGAGEGYSAALLNELADTVIALEAEQDVADKAMSLMSDLGSDRVACVSGELTAGFPSEGPYDVILVNGLVEFVPDAWLEQLSVGGRLGVVVGNQRKGEARIYTRTAGSTSYHVEYDCVPPMLKGVALEKGFSF
tara:strand:- start:9472 stop:10122 length:651 start_codon:yes stop_codon:yes gene_type:complete